MSEWARGMCRSDRLIGTGQQCPCVCMRGATSRRCDAERAHGTWPSPCPLPEHWERKLGLRGRGARLRSKSLEQRHFIPRVVIRKLIDELARQEDSESAGAETFIIANAQMRRHVLGLRSVREVFAIEARAVIADDDDDLFRID